MNPVVEMRELAKAVKCTRSSDSTYQECLEQYGFAVLELGGGEALSLEAIMQPLGEPVSYRFGAKLTMEQQQGTDNSQFRTGAIPMHVDAILNATDVSFIGMECIEAPVRGGETLIVRSEAFFAVAPSDLVDTLRNIEIEYWSNVSDFYINHDGQNTIASPIRLDPVTGGETLYLGVSYPQDTTRNFGAAVVGYSDADSLSLFKELADVLNRPDVVYKHRWQVGQVLVLDNRRVLHGRQPYNANESRKLIRVSVV